MYSPCLAIICIGLEQLTAAEIVTSGICTDSKVGSVTISLERAGTDTIVGIGLGDIQSGTDIQSQRLKAVDLIVNCSPSYETQACCIAYIVIKC